jgi:hypothetical protein
MGWGQRCCQGVDVIDFEGMRSGDRWLKVTDVGQYCRQLRLGVLNDKTEISGTLNTPGERKFVDAGATKHLPRPKMVREPFHGTLGVYMDTWW